MVQGVRPGGPDPHAVDHDRVGVKFAGPLQPPEQAIAAGTSSQRQLVAKRNQITRNTLRCAIGGRPPSRPTGRSGGEGDEKGPLLNTPGN